MLENKSLNDCILYLFTSKRWNMDTHLLKSWNDLLKDINIIYIRKAIEKGIEETGHITVGHIKKWANEIKEEARESQKHTQIEYQEDYFFCDWCLKMEVFTGWPNAYYCKVCSNKYVQDKALTIKKIFEAGKIDELAKCRKYILDNKFNFDLMRKYLKKVYPLNKKLAVMVRQELGLPEPIATDFGSNGFGNY